MKLVVEAQVRGEFLHVGDLETLPAYGPVFSYADSWLERPDAKPLSVSLPLTHDSMSERLIRPYFEGLLPEGDARASLARALGVSQTSWFKLLAAVGDECIGAISVRDEESPEEEADYNQISEEDLLRLGETGNAGTTKFSIKARLSLAGAQAKTGLYQDPETRLWYQPKGRAPSNRIVKPASHRFNQLIENEAFCMDLARRCGLPCASSRQLGQLYMTDRYDRVPMPDSYVSGHPAYARLHQEDFCQALGVLSQDKYEEMRDGNLSRVGRLLREYSTAPAQDVLLFFDMLLFDRIIGNCDCHLKNFSIMRDETWAALRLAPAYDLVSTTVYPELSRSFGMRVGGEKTIDRMDRASFLRAARDLHIGRKVAASHIDSMRERVSEAIETSGGSAIAEDIAGQAKRSLHDLAPSTSVGTDHGAHRHRVIPKSEELEYVKPGDSTMTETIASENDSKTSDISNQTATEQH